MSTITVIVPVYKVEVYIHRCVDSILSQNYTDFELILVDDGSPDLCGTICDEYAKQDSRVHVIHQENHGLSAARNAGIDWAFDNSNSQWLTFIDSDDWVHRDYLRILLNSAINTNLPLSICSFVRTYGKEPIVPAVQFETQTWSSTDYYLDHHINATIACGKLYKKSSFQNIRYPIGKLHEDEFTTYKLLFSTGKVAVTEAPLYYYFQNDNGITGSTWSPRRLVFLSAISERIRFFKQKNLLSVYKWQIKNYPYEVLEYQAELNKTPLPNKTKYSKLLRHHMREALRFGRKSGVIPFHGNEHLYENAHPKYMKLYWFLKVIQNKLLRKR